jgi:hypothetical protein
MPWYRLPYAQSISIQHDTAAYAGLALRSLALKKQFSDTRTLARVLLSPYN